MLLTQFPTIRTEFVVDRQSELEAGNGCLDNKEAVESVPITYAGQRVENQIAELVRSAHIGLG